MPLSPLSQGLHGPEQPLPGETEEERKKRLAGLYAAQNRATAALGINSGPSFSPLMTGLMRGY